MRLHEDKKLFQEAVRFTAQQMEILDTLRKIKTRIEND